jgi:hypothetical protein
MRAIRVVFRAELQHRWRSWLALTVLVALVGGTVLGAIAAGRRFARRCEHCSENKSAAHDDS